MLIHHKQLKRLKKRIQDGTITEEEIKKIDEEMKDCEENPESYLTQDQIAEAMRDGRDVAYHVFRKRTDKSGMTGDA